jgi:adenine-specific DNA-methyltransferase
VKEEQIVGFGDVPPEDFHPTGDVVEREDGTLEVWPIDTKDIERKWRYARDSVVQIQQLLSVKQVGQHTQIHITKNFGAYRTVWQGNLHDASTHGTQLLAKFLGKGKFPFPKSLYTMREILYACTANRPNALIVDYFAGSGTTLHATMLLNQQIGGARRCILVTNNEVEDSLSTTLYRKHIYRGDSRFEKHGIFEAVTKPRIVAAITGKRAGKRITGKYATGTFIGAGFKENVTFLRLDYLDPDSIELGERFHAVAQALWLAAGGIGDLDDLPEKLVEYYIPKSSPYAVLFRVSRRSKFLAALEKRPDISLVWVVTNSEEAYAEACESLPPRIRRTSQLYRDYLRTFKINAERR